MTRGASQVPPTRVLILGGSSEATALVAALTGRSEIDATVSLAGRTATPIVSAIATRVGGFGGIDGLVNYIRAERIDVLVDATHPFAVQISRNARAAAEQTDCRLVEVTRAPWQPLPNDRWIEVESMAAAAAALGATPLRVFLTIGRLQLSAFAGAPQHSYLVRSIEAAGPDHGLAHATFIKARGPFAVDEEEGLMRDHHIDVLVTKNSGGAASVAKLEAARRLGLSVILVQRPEPFDGCAVGIDEAVAKILAHHLGSAQRGV